MWASRVQREAVQTSQVPWHQNTHCRGGNRQVGVPTSACVQQVNHHCRTETHRHLDWIFERFGNVICDPPGSQHAKYKFYLLKSSLGKVFQKWLIFHVFTILGVDEGLPWVRPWFLGESRGRGVKCNLDGRSMQIYEGLFCFYFELMKVFHEGHIGKVFWLHWFSGRSFDCTSVTQWKVFLL